MGFLAFHHVRPFADGGPPTEENIELRCRAHNGYEAELDFGLRNRSGVSEPRGIYQVNRSQLDPPVQIDRRSRTDFG
jgi:hypothetical protein